MEKIRIRIRIIKKKKRERERGEERRGIYMIYDIYSISYICICISI